MKDSRLYSILFNKCPKCHKGSFFTNSGFNIRKFSEMNQKCPVCSEDFRRETGFYFGAMYASYGLTVLYGILLFLLMVVGFKADVLVFLFTFTGTVILLLPFFYRKSRLIWINIFVSKKK